jgi:small subunit ribosomal protein S20
MANIASQIKRIQTNEKARVQNATFKTQMRTAIKRAVALATKKDKEGLKPLLVLACKLIDKSVSHGVQTLATAGRQKSRLQARIAKLIA